MACMQPLLYYCMVWRQKSKPPINLSILHWMVGVIQQMRWLAKLVIGNLAMGQPRHLSHCHHSCKTYSYHLYASGEGGWGKKAKYSTDVQQNNVQRWRTSARNRNESSAITIHCSCWSAVLSKLNYQLQQCQKLNFSNLTRTWNNSKN